MNLLNRIRVRVEQFNGGGRLFKFIKCCPVFAISGVFAYSYFSFVYLICLKSMEPSIRQLLSIMFYHVSLGLTLGSYYRAVFTNTGSIPDKFKIRIDVMEQLKKVSDFEKKKILGEIVHTRKLDVQTTSSFYPGQIRMCEFCNIIKPDRTHHCRVCGHCVTRMDHHCPFINNCIGFLNIKYFLLFLLHSHIFATFICLSTLPLMIDYWNGHIWKYFYIDKFPIVVTFMGSLTFSIACITKFFFNLLAAAKNVTVLDFVQPPEFKSGEDTFGFDVGWGNNLAQVFGRNVTKWLIPVFSSTIPDGTSFPSRHSGIKNDAESGSCSKSMAAVAPSPEEYTANTTFMYISNF